ncbi:MAG: hypothetical protein E6Q97_09085 [Desulfurellales bacterium]|nr:MAG: hypothetical protein E6Q97_09085 [Desulfurellales bacterium]
MNEVKLPRIEMAGRYKIEVRRRGELVHDTGWFDNLITNAGLEAIGEDKRLSRYCMVGTDNTAPANTNTTLGAQIAYQDGTSATSQGVETSSPRYGWFRNTYTFPQGAVVGNVAEVGVGWSTTAVFSRSLVSPAISLLSIDQLTVVYELRMYLPTTNTTGSVTIGGDTYNYTIRPALAATSFFAGSGSWAGWVPALLTLGATTRAWANGSPAAFSFGPPCVVQTDVEVASLKQTDGGTNSPGGSNPSDTPDSVSNAAYVPGSLSCQFTLTWGISRGNSTGGIRGFLYSGLFGTYQCVLDATIPKDNTKTLAMTWSQTWARRP